VHFLLTIFITVLFLLLPCIITLFLHLLGTNHKCTQPCYFPPLLKPTAQKEKMDWNSSSKSSRLRVAPVAVPVELWSLPLFLFIESRHSLYSHYLCNNYSLFMTFGYLWTLLGRICGTIDSGSCIRWVLGFGIKIGYDIRQTPRSFKITILDIPQMTSRLRGGSHEWVR
jgi:hypothetical protein